MDASRLRGSSDCTSTATVEARDGLLDRDRAAAIATARRGCDPDVSGGHGTCRRPTVSLATAFHAGATGVYGRRFQRQAAPHRRRARSSGPPTAAAAPGGVAQLESNRVAAPSSRAARWDRRMTVIGSGFDSRRLHSFGGPKGLDYQPARSLGGLQSREGRHPAHHSSATLHPIRPQWCGPKRSSKQQRGALAMTYLSKWFNFKKTPQSAPIPGTSQVRNDNAGYVWAVDDWARLDRFLILGSEGGIVLRVGAQADARERRGGPALHRRRRRARRRAHRRRVGRGPRAQERPGAVRAGARREAGRRAHAPRGARRAAAGRAHRHAPVPLRRVRQGAGRLGPRHDAGVRALVQRHGREPSRRSRP